VTLVPIAALDAPIGAFNVITLEHAEAIVAGAEAARRPVVLQISENAIRFHAGRPGPLAAACTVLARQSTVDVALHLDHALIAALHAVVPVPLVLHGSSGLPDGELVRAVAGGIAKVNIGTALNVAYTTAVRAGTSVDPRGYLDSAREAMAQTVAHLLHVLSGSGA